MVDLRQGIQEAAATLGMSPVDLATIISYETGGTFNPAQPGPTTQWGQHRGLIQFGEPQAAQYGVDWNNPAGSQLGADGAIVRYFQGNGWQPGMGLLDAYSIVNAGGPGRYNASDANNGGAPGTVADKVNEQMGGHRANAERMFGAAGMDVMTGGQGGDRMATQGLLSAPQEPARRPSIWDRLEGVPILGGLADPDRRARLAIGLGGMSLNPNQMLMAMNAQGIQDRANERETTGRMNQTIAYLQSVGRDDLVALVQAGMDPGSALQASQPENLSPLEQAQLEQIQLETEQMRTAVPAGPDLPADVASLQWRAEQMGLVPGSAEYQAFIAANGASVVPPSTVEPEGATDLRVRWEALTPVKQFQQVTGAYQAAQSNAQLQTPSGDLALVYNMMNILDPGASVMEGDYRNATTNPGVIGAISSALAQAQGDGLSDEKRAEILGQIEAAYKSKWQAYTQTANQYEATATRQGYDPQATITEYRPQLPNGGSIRGNAWFDPNQVQPYAPERPATPAPSAAPAPTVMPGPNNVPPSSVAPPRFASNQTFQLKAQELGITIDELWRNVPENRRAEWLN